MLKVSITSPVYGVPFKGLYIEAYDLETHEKIGKFNEVENANVLLDGLAITHADRKDKEEAHFLWTPLDNRHGEVYFRCDRNRISMWNFLFNYFFFFPVDILCRILPHSGRMYVPKM